MAKFIAEIVNDKTVYALPDIGGESDGLVFPVLVPVVKIVAGDLLIQNRDRCREHVFSILLQVWREHFDIQPKGDETQVSQDKFIPALSGPVLCACNQLSFFGQGYFLETGMCLVEILQHRIIVGILRWRH